MCASVSEFLLEVGKALFYEPGLRLVYGPPFALKTSTVLAALSLTGKGRCNCLKVYVATGKHAYIDPPLEDIVTVRARSLVGELLGLFELERLMLSKGSGNACIVVDTILGNILPARAFLAERVIMKALLFELNFYRHLASEHGASVVLMGVSREYSDEPLFWSILGRLVDSALHFYVDREEAALIVRRLSNRLEEVGKMTIQLEAIEGAWVGVCEQGT